MDIIGLLPAAGRGSRLGTIPCSKEIMPLGFQRTQTTDGPRWLPVTAIETHLRALALAGAQRAVIIVSEAKYDVVQYLGDGSRYDLDLAYCYQQRLRGMPFALDLAASWMQNATTVFAMPDTYITPTSVNAQLLAAHQTHPADVTLGLFETSTPHKFGMVDCDATGRITRFVDKPQQTELRRMWGLAVWTPRFTSFMRSYLTQRQHAQHELVLSDVFAAAAQAGLHIRGEQLADAVYHDIGTPEDFQAVVYRLAHEQATFDTNPLV